MLKKYIYKGKLYWYEEHKQPTGAVLVEKKPKNKMRKPRIKEETRYVN